MSLINLSVIPLGSLDTENPLQDSFEEIGDKEEEPESVLETKIEEVSDMGTLNCKFR